MVELNWLFIHVCTLGIKNLIQSNFMYATYSYISEQRLLVPILIEFRKFILTLMCVCQVKNRKAMWYRTVVIWPKHRSKKENIGLLLVLLPTSVIEMDRFQRIDIYNYEIIPFVSKKICFNWNFAFSVYH